jgi:hypothetical protein
MTAGLGVNTIFLEHQPGNWGSINNMRLDDLCYIFRLYSSIPDSFGIDYNGRAMFTLVKTSRSISSHGFFQSTKEELFFEGQLEVSHSLRITASARIVGSTLISTDKYMMEKL